MKTFNKRGDQGETSLLYGVRIPKSDLHCEANGAIDEANSALGLARAFSKNRRVQDIILSIQKELFILSQLALREVSLKKKCLKLKSSSTMV